MKLFKPRNTVIPPVVVETKQFEYQPTPVVIVEANVKEYKDAFEAARGRYVQQRAKIYDVYQNALDFDLHLSSLITRRIQNTSGKKLQYLIAGQPSEAAERLTRGDRFTKFIEDILMYQFWGMRLFEIEIVGNWFDYKIIPIKHVDPFAKMVRRDQYSTNQADKSFEGVSGIVFLGDGYNYGYLQQLSLIALYKRAAMGDWAQYSQLAGTNFRTVKYRGVSPDRMQRSRMRDIVQNAGSGVLDLPEGIDVTTSNQTSSSQNELFENYVRYLDDLQTKSVLGQTMTTEDGSSRSQAEVHERTQADIFDFDGKELLNILNYSFSDLLGVSGGEWSFVESNTQQQMDELTKDKALKDLGVVWTDQELREKYNIKPMQNVGSQL